MTKKIVLAAALLHGPSVLFLDEPFEAIDPVSARTIEAVLRRHVDQGARWCSRRTCSTWSSGSATTWP
ncbi:MAG: hypothetical protein R2699_06270 [Acidimicrobiales bacterium]